jgi:hypothetical protein
VHPPRNGLASAANPRPTLCTPRLANSSATACSATVDIWAFLSHSSFPDPTQVGLTTLIVPGQQGSSDDGTVDYVTVMEEVWAAYPAASSSRGVGTSGARTHCRGRF